MPDVDSQEQVSGEGQVEETQAVTEETASSDDEGDSEDEKFDFDSFKQEISNVRETRGDPNERFARQLGHVSALQKTVSQLEKKLEETSSSVVTRKDFDALIDSIAELLPDDRRQPLQAQRTERAIEEAVRRALPKQEVEEFETEDPRVSAAIAYQERVNAQLQTASRAVLEYAGKKGVTLTREDFLQAQSEAGQFNVEGAVEKMIQMVDSRSGGGKASRRAERKAAAEGGADGSAREAGGAADLSTLTGLIRAKQRGQITSDQWYERYQELKREKGF